MQEVLDLLSSLGIKYNKFDHLAVYTCDEAREFQTLTNSARTKNLFLVGEKSRNFYLYILECEAKADLKKLAAKLGESRLTFAKEPDLLHFLGLTPGSVSPFGLIRDTKHQVQVVINTNLKKYSWLSFHPNTNTATVEIKWNDFIKFLTSIDHLPSKLYNLYH
jgi:Ala-tRNA(Pro) deacylase